jgi:EamA domain-containing membrane protein RarD
MQVPKTDEVGSANWSRTLLLMLCVTLLWFAMEVVFASLSRYSIVQIVWTRYCIHLFCMLLVLGPQRFLRSAGTQRAVLHIGRGALMIIMPVLGVVAMSRMRVAEFMAVFWLLPLLVVAMARLQCRHRIHLRYWAVCIMAYAGVLAIFRPGAAIFNTDVLLAFGSGSSFGIYIVLTHRLQKSESIQTNLLYTALVVICPLTLVLHHYWQTPSPMDAVRMIIMGILGLATLWCLEKAMERCGPEDLAPVLFLFPLWGFLARRIYSGSGAGLTAIIGALVVAASLLVHSLFQYKAQGRSAFGRDCLWGA